MLTAQQKWINELIDNPIYLMATLLHPRYRMEWLKGVLKKCGITDSQAIISTFGTLKSMWTDWVAQHNRAERDKHQSNEGRAIRRKTLVKEARENTIDDVASKILGHWTSADDEDEYDQFLRETASQDFNALEWWLHPTQQKRWPRLSIYAVSIFSFPPMSDEPERVFSGGRRQISWERSRLSPNVVEASECLRHVLASPV
jgi:hypothetical protein